MKAEEIALEMQLQHIRLASNLSSTGDVSVDFAGVTKQQSPSKAATVIKYAAITGAGVSEVLGYLCSPDKSPIPPGDSNAALLNGNGHIKQDALGTNLFQNGDIDSGGSLWVNVIGSDGLPSIPGPVVLPPGWFLRVTTQNNAFAAPLQFVLDVAFYILPLPA